MFIGLILYLFYTRWTLQIIQIDKTWVFTVTPPHPLSCPQLPQIASKLCTLGIWQIQCIKYHFIINLALLSDNNFYDTSYSLSQRVIAGSTSFSDNSSGRSNPGVKVFFFFILSTSFSGKATEKKQQGYGSKENRFKRKNVEFSEKA